VKRRRDHSDELQALEERRTELTGEIERAQRAREEAAAALAGATRTAAAALLDEVGREEAAAARRTAEEKRAAAGADLELLREALAELDRRIAAKRAEVEAEQRDAAQAALERGGVAKAKVAEKVAGSLSAALEDVRELVAAREAVKDLRAKVAELGGDQFADYADEAPWPEGVRELVEFLTSSKPERPLEQREREERQRALDAENAVRSERLRWLEQARALAQTSWNDEEDAQRRERFFASVPEQLRDELRAEHDRVRATVLARRRGFDRVDA
jgi:hypothetical protein